MNIKTGDIMVERGREHRRLLGNTPKWAVLYNIVSTGSTWIGTGWEFFDSEILAKACYEHQLHVGNCPTMRPYHRNDAVHLGAVHRITAAEKV